MENLKLDIVALTETKKRVVDRKQLEISDISIVEYPKTNEQRGGSLNSLKEEPLVGILQTGKVSMKT